jgi:DNA-binding transcriptional ArsR family regulator
MHADTQVRMDRLEMPTDDQVGFASDGFRMLADPTRIKILWALLHGESSVAHLAGVVGATPAAVSQHLAKLRLAKLVRVRREGTFAYYSAVDDHVARLLTEALDHAEHQVVDPAGGGRAPGARAASRSRRP